MAKSRKRPKPYLDFPLTAHRNGQWCKKIRGKLYYFGVDADAALQKYLDEKDDLQAGRTPRASTTSCGLAEMINEYLADADARRAAGELSALSFRDYKWTGEQMVAHFGRSVDPTQIRPTEFAGFRNALAAKYAPSRLGKTVTVCRMMFSWAFESEVIDHMPRFGPGFKAATKRTKRLAKAAAGSRAFEAAELLSLMRAARPQYKAMILLGVNCGFGNTDLSKLTHSAIKGGWIEFPRPKTGIDRRCPLWPETLNALNRVQCPEPASRDLADRVFLTSRGTELVDIQDDGRRVDKVTIVFRNLMNDTGCYRKGRGFYGLRHTLETVGGGAKDQVALDAIMGHVDASVAETYRHGVEDERLQAVTDHVRAWLLLRVIQHRRKWIIVGGLQDHYWTGTNWSTKSDDVLQFPTEKDANAYLAERRAQLIAVPFEEDVEDKAPHPDILPMSCQSVG